MDKLSGFDLDQIAEHSASTNGSKEDALKKADAGLARHDSVESLGHSPPSGTARRQSHTGSTRPHVSQSTNRIVSGGKDGLKSGRNNLMQGVVSPPISSAGRQPHNSLLDAVVGKSNVPRKQKPVGFKDKLKKEEGKFKTSFLLSRSI